MLSLHISHMSFVVAAPSCLGAGIVDAIVEQRERYVHCCRVYQGKLTDLIDDTMTLLVPVHLVWGGWLRERVTSGKGIFG